MKTSTQLGSFARMVSAFTALAMVFGTLAFAETPGQSCPSVTVSRRTIDGSCNHRGRPELGAASSVFIDRHLFPIYDYRLSAPNQPMVFTTRRALEEGEVNSFPFPPGPGANPDGECTVNPPLGTEPEGTPVCPFTLELASVRRVAHYYPPFERSVDLKLHRQPRVPGLPPGPPTEFSPLPDFVTPNETSVFAVAFGNFVLHDISSLAMDGVQEDRTTGEANLNDPDNPLANDGAGVQGYGIPIPAGDPLFLFGPAAGFPALSEWSFPVLTLSGPRFEINDNGLPEFFNERTAWVDGDGIYGESEARSRALRSGIGGRLLLKSMHVPLVPIESFAFLGCSPSSPADFCSHPACSSLCVELEDFLPSAAETGLPIDPNLPAAGFPSLNAAAGDFRGPENLALNTVHLIWVRFHNYLTARCVDLHPDVDGDTTEGDELLFECARRLTVAAYQRVVYEEFIPAMAGGRTVSTCDAYRPWVDPQTSKLMSVAAGRLHSMVRTNFEVRNPDGTLDVRMQLPPPPASTGVPAAPSATYLFAGQSFPGQFGSVGYLTAAAGYNLGGGPDLGAQFADPYQNITRGMLYSYAAANDRFISDSLTLIPGAAPVSVPSFTYRRNREQGLAPANVVRRRFLGLAGAIYGKEGCPVSAAFDAQPDPLACFQRIVDSAEDAQALQDAVGEVVKMPPFALFTVEDHRPASELTKTQERVWLGEFGRKCRADRFFYTRHLSAEELEWLKSYSMAEIIRVTLGEATHVQANPFKVPAPAFFQPSL